MLENVQNLHIIVDIICSTILMICLTILLWIGSDYLYEILDFKSYKLKLKKNLYKELYKYSNYNFIYNKYINKRAEKKFKLLKLLEK